MSKRRIGILGGTFDPPHIGHLILAEYARVALDFERLLFVPAADPPHKREENKVAIEHRLAMLERAIAGNEHFIISRTDIDRTGPHYSVDMVRLIGEAHPDAELYFVMGGDSLRDLPTWYHPAELIRLCKLAVMRRPEETIQPDMHEKILPGLAERVVMIDAPLVGISSTMIVERISRGQSVRYLVPDTVLDYILECRLYETP
ncbi:MAG: nicotinate-nucleotide adenylyltransferase [Anaerolineae bacterium]|nr:nicotinate-nucleotide adenylyltransferase [Anaerolineae bacterium]